MLIVFGEQCCLCGSISLDLLNLFDDDLIILHFERS